MTVLKTHYVLPQCAYKIKEEIYHGLRLQSIWKKCYNGKNTSNAPQLNVNVPAKRKHYLKLLASGFQNKWLLCFNKLGGKTLATRDWISKQTLVDGLLKFNIRILL